jgi:PST family polysaccharide transporter
MTAPAGAHAAGGSPAAGAPGDGSAPAAGRNFAGASWLALSKAGSQAFSWVGTLYVASRLTPEDYGLSNLSTAFTEFAYILTNSGLGTTLIQRQDGPGDRSRSDSLFTLSLFIGVFLALCALVLSYFGAWYFRNPELIPLTQFTAVTYILTTLAIVPYNHLNRDMRFKERGLLDMYSTWISIAAQVAMAALGFGVWTLVFGVAVRAGVRLWLAFRYSGYRPSFGFDWGVIRGDLGFSARLTFNWLLFVIKERSIPVLIGRSHSVAQLGYLGFAGSLAGIPNLKVVQLLREVLLPLLARRSGRPGEQLRGLATAMKGMALFVAPLYLAGYWYGEAALRHLLPAKWEPMFPLFQVLCLVQLWTVLSSIVAIYNTAQGRPGRSTAYDLAMALLVPGLTFLLRAEDLRFLAHVWSAVGAAVFLAWFAFLFRGEGAFLRGFTGCLLGAAAACGTAFLFDAFVLAPRLPEEALTGSLLRLAAFAAFYLGFLRVFHWGFLRELRRK